MDVRIFDHLDALPQSHRTLFENAGRDDFFSSLTWYQTFIDHATAPDQALRIYVAETDGQPTVALPLRTPDEQRPLRELDSCSNAFTTRFAPVADAGATDIAAGLTAIGHAIAAERPRWDYLRIGALPADEAVYDDLLQAFRSAGLWTQPFRHFGNWYEDVRGLSFETYVRDVSKSLRQIWNRACRDDAPTFHLITEPAGVEWGISAYETVYASSWKEPERFPQFMPELMRNAAAAGALRLGVLTYRDQPVAAQLWLVGGARCTIFKVAHDEAHKRLSPGTALTFHMLRHVLDNDGVAEIDFGCGDDPYKRRWLPQRRLRMGVAAFNPRSIRGATMGAAHVWGSPLKQWLRQLNRANPEQKNSIL
ncbi:GNAT family N-acetyltransferase [Aquisalimonas asiatica]|uniref:Acetyltransferase involved in cellulose biosynthesis, CelD/BcsL family n=1 Tax=Aquisalimonas asiatica TaxID=406100 RepID=A0A1H8U671_9GAMM|nr:GNAT family N-acetyltransferase [Aquisalimonas asiatica]SEO98158.1 Acetyltransferase involved in cellulose biosynthesis, CelD/BcsL family [Aquisalimonas asiatica]